MVDRPLIAKLVIALVIVGAAVGGYFMCGPGASDNGPGLYQPHRINKPPPGFFGPHGNTQSGGSK